MNLKKGKFKIVEGTRVRMVSSKDTHIVEGAYGTVVSPGIRESEVRWDSMLAIRADYRYRNELKDALIIPVYNDLLDPSGNFQIWSHGTEQNGIRTMCILKVTLTLSVLKL